jgi:hypothetical protein
MLFFTTGKLKLAREHKEHRENAKHELGNTPDISKKRLQI